MSITSREELFSKIGRAKRRYRNVHLPVCNSTVRIRSLTEGELSRWQQRLLRKDGRSLDPSAARAANRSLFALCMVDDNGDRLMADNESANLADMDSADSSKLYEEIQEHLGVDPSDLGDTGELEKNCETTDEDSSPSD